jgi:zinc/manganese transport system permease protein
VFILLSTGIGALSAVLGIVLSAALNLSSGPSIVVAQFALFIIASVLFRLRLVSAPKRA